MHSKQQQESPSLGDALDFQLGLMLPLSFCHQGRTRGTPHLMEGQELPSPPIVVLLRRMRPFAEHI